MEIKSSDDAKKNIIEFSSRLLNLLKDRKSIDEDIKALKQEFKEEGVPVGVVNKMINKIKAEAKQSTTEIFEQETIKEWLESDTTISDKIGQLVD